MAILIFAVMLTLVLKQPPINPQVLAEPVWVNPATRTLAQQACYDCPSNQTKWPLYSLLPFVRGLIVRHVLVGRRRINFSRWKSGLVCESNIVAGQVYDPNFNKIGDRFNLPNYTLMHPHARLNHVERNQLAHGF